ncbi:MAG: D-glycero-D-manno-heptose 1,7-bisphosphate phosphatase [Candidatus Paceibacteria bacterium]|jgi:D-glycero-D-manno-heptose 1,7-bisphosphate phosphatase
MTNSPAPNEPKRPAVFLDRDGTINAEVDYLSRPEDLKLLDGAGAAIARLNKAGYLCVVITNQSGIARGLFDEEQLNKIHARMDDLLAEEGASIDHYGYCPHHPQNGNKTYRKKCECRKPKPGLLLEAQAALSIDMSRSWIVGDSPRDLQAGIAVDIPGILVETGKPLQDLARERYEVLADLSAAVDRILAQG